MKKKECDDQELGDGGMGRCYSTDLVSVLQDEIVLEIGCTT